MNGTQASALGGGTRLAPIVGLGALVATVAFVAVVAFGGAPDGRSNGGGVVLPNASPSAAPIVTPRPSEEPSESPSEQPSDDPSAAPTEEPGDGGTDGMPIRVDLQVVDGHHEVYVDVVDRSGLLVDAETGTPADGASVDYEAVEVENLDAKTLRLTWTDYPIDNALALFIDETEGGLQLILVRPDPTGVTDSVGMDRELVLTFASPVSADDVTASVQDGLDTAG